jgi:hypothetical protein
MKITDWRECIRNRIKWKKLVEKAQTSLKFLRLKKKKKKKKKKCLLIRMTWSVG